MANPEHVAILKRGVEVWNRWRRAHPGIQIDLGEATLNEASLQNANLRCAYLNEASIRRADLSGADLTKATLTQINFHGANLSVSRLCRADLSGSNLVGTDLRQADMSEASLRGVTLVRANLVEANLTGCSIYGISVWDSQLEGANQSNLIITPPSEPIITVDNLEVAQFIYLLLHNEKIRHVIDTITSKVVLILGRFTPERKVILDAIKDELRYHDFLPVLFDFPMPESRNFIETVSTLAHMARFVIADMTEPRIVLQEVPHIVENIAVPLIPLLLEGEEEPVTLYDLRRNHRSILPTLRYTNSDDLLTSLEEKVIVPAQAKVEELRKIG